MQILEQLKTQEHKTANGHLILKECPFCGNSNYKFYINEKTGAWDCKVCANNGGIGSLKKELMLTKDTKIDIDKYHENLLKGEDGVLDYLVVDRGLTEDTIRYFKLGSINKQLFIPFLETKGSFYKTRTIPPAERAFYNASGPIQLFNASCINSETTELYIVEGEIDAMSMWQLGYQNVVSVPGANTKKNEWIKLIDSSNIKTIYLIYDNDKVGQDAAKKMAEKLGVNKCRNVIVPSHKDINELLVTETNCKELIEEAIKNGKQCKIEGVYTSSEVFDELISDFEGRGSKPTYTTVWWPSLASKMGGYEPGDLIGLLAPPKIGKTTTALNWCYLHTKTYKEPSALFCLEMLPKRSMRKLVSFLTQTDDSVGSSEMTVEKIRDAITIMESDGVSKDDFIFAKHEGETSSVFDKIRNLVRIYGVKFVCFDNLHLLSRDLANATQELNILSKKFKQIAQELNIVILLILQPHRLQEGKTVSARNISGSSAPEKDVDTLICLHRAKTLSGITEDDLTNNSGALNTSSTFHPQMLMNVELSRYSAGGMCVLYLDGARSTLRELGTEEEVVKEIKQIAIEEV